MVGKITFLDNIIFYERISQIMDALLSHYIINMFNTGSSKFQFKTIFKGV
jgi:hypothetical protein